MKRKVNCYNIFVILLTISFVLSMISFLSYNFELSFNRYNLLKLDLPNERKTKDDVKTILFWNSFFGDPLWGMSKSTYNEYDLKKIGCSFSNCIFTHDKNYLKSSHLYDAIVYHGAENFWKGSYSDIPSIRSSNQLYIMASLESPGEIKHNLKLDNEFFNLTMTYRLDSDIVWPYGFVKDKLTDQIIAPKYEPMWRSIDEDEQNLTQDSDIMNVIRKKNKTAAWMVSHCSTISGRDELTEKLQSLNIDVDVYGKCGTKQCPRNSPKCQEMLNSDYFFYFSFENTLCNDYITEKVFSVLNNYVVPVVFNGAQMKRFLPPKSYINVENFEKIEDLANYLKYLTENIDEYLEYFWWKKFYDVIPDGSLPLCQMCEKINEFSSQSRRKQVYENIFEWFYSDQCRRSKIRF